MTLVFGQKFFHGLVMLTDSRVTFVDPNKGSKTSADIAQKLFYLPNNIFIGFSGDIQFASDILARFIAEVKKNPKLQSIKVLKDKGPKILKYCYEYVAMARKRSPVNSFVIGGLELNRPVSYKNKDGTFGHFGNMHEGHLLAVDFPNYKVTEVNHKTPNIFRGSGSIIAAGISDSIAKFQFGVAQPMNFLGMLVDIVLKEEIAKLGVESVGGLYQIGIVDSNGARFLPYQARSSTNRDPNAPLDLELAVNSSGRFIQRNLIDRKEVPLLYPPEIIEIQIPINEIFAKILED